MLSIITQPHPLLRQKAKEIPLSEIASDQVQKLIKEMVPTMRQANGLGVAAPQVEQGVRLAVIERKYADQVEEVLVLINPTITKKSLRQVAGEEGCLSIPGYFGIVKRYKTVTVEYYDARAKQRKLKTKDLLARVIQHEIDHLDGILFIDKADKIYQLKSETRVA